MNSSSKALRREDAEARFDSAARARDTQARPDPTPVTVQVWDPALRAFHWSLAASVSVALVSGEIGGPWIEWHGRAGEAIAGLLAFRLAWGLIGPPTARFTSFVRGPATIRRYLHGEWQGIGHNPLGALSVLALLLLGALQVASGLFSNDDIAFQGPLAVLVDSDWSDRASGVHQKLAWLLIGMVCVHLLAIAWYRLVRKHDLVGPMLHGRRTLAPRGLHPRAAKVGEASATTGDGLSDSPDARFSLARFLIATGVAILAVALASGRLLPEASASAATPTAATTPSSPAAPAQAPARPAW